MSIAIRIKKLEALGRSGEIPIWCDDETDVPVTIDAMIDEGELQESERLRCVYWTHMRASAGYHERALGMLP
jgi:hypothetical protein